MSCFKAGTLIAAKTGEVRIESLVPGQLVLTRDNGYRPVRWTGVRHLTGRYLFDNPHLRPVMVLKDAFGPGLPRQRTSMSPNTRLPFAKATGSLAISRREDMVAVKQFIDHDTVQQVDMTGITYIHLMFSRHEVISVNGVWTECFKASDYSLGTLGNAQREEVLEVFPNLRRRKDPRPGRIPARGKVSHEFSDLF
ncbi:MAG: Hint domain-containing protein [Paracoccaceae bacterium]